SERNFDAVAGHAVTRSDSPLSWSPLSVAGTPCRRIGDDLTSDERREREGGGMDAELLELQRQFESVQQAKSSVRLSERNVVELVQKLQELRFIDFDLLHTVSGKEYITPDQLRLEMEAEIKKSGRVSLIDLSDIIGVDLYHIERQAQQIVSNDLGLMLIQGEIISQSYWDNVAEEINEKLEECSQIALAEIAAQYHVGSELVLSVLEPRMGTLVKGRLEGGQLYTPAYVARVSAMVRGASRGITVPTNLPTVWSSLQQLLQEMVGSNGVSVETAFLQSLFNGHVKEGEILGSLRAGVQWTPSVFAHAQRESVDSFFSQNSFISYDVLHKLSIPQPRQYLQSRYPDGIPLDNFFIHPSMVEMLDAAIQDAIDHGNWIDALSVLPASIGSHDASKLLSLSPSVQKALKSSKAIVLGESCIFSSVYIKGLFDKMEKELETLGYSGPAIQVLNSSQQSVSNEAGDDDVADKNISEKGSKRKKGKSTGSAKAVTTENDPASQEIFPTRSKKNQRRNKEIASTDVSGVKMGNRKAVEKLEENQNIPSEEWVLLKIMTLAPDLEEIGDPDDSQILLRHLAFHLRPMLVSSWKKRRSMLLVETAERRRRLLDNLQRQLDEAYLDLQLYEKALELFEDEPSTSIILHKHLLKTMATGIVDKFLVFLDMDNKLKNGMEVEDNQALSSVPLSSGERSALAKNLSGPLSVKAQATVEALEGKDLMSQISLEIDSVAFLPKVIALLYLQVHNKALQAPGRAISAAISRLKDKVPDSTFKILTDYHTATVTLLALLAAATGEEDDCTSDRILSKRELLESKMPELKSLVLGNTNS
ncbi:hypothetical protein Taro_039665, partial [Colocasia esculenta]|nr:hypothetical protein [Colocasia esculenta]